MAKTQAKKKAAAKKKPANKKPKAAKKSKISALSKKIADSKRRLQRAKDTAVREGERLFNYAVKELFEDNPGLHSFSWNQYKPHWNDGDDCVFGTYFDSLKINDEEEPECMYTLENLRHLLSDKKAEARIIMELSGGNKDKWEVERLKKDLESIRTRSLEEVSEKHRIKKSIQGLLSNIDDSVYENMFGEGTVVMTREGASVESCQHD